MICCLIDLFKDLFKFLCLILVLFKIFLFSTAVKEVFMAYIDPPYAWKDRSNSLLDQSPSSENKKMPISEACKASICCFLASPEDACTKSTLCLGTWSTLALGAGAGIAFGVHSAAVGTGLVTGAVIDAVLTSCCFCSSTKC